MNSSLTFESEANVVSYAVIHSTEIDVTCVPSHLLAPSRGRHKKCFAPHPGEVVRSQWRSLENLVGHEENVLLTTTSRRAQLRSRSKSMKLTVLYVRTCM